MLLPAFLNAASFSDIMTAAQTHGTAVSSAAEEYESGMIGAYLASLDDKPSFTVSAAVSPLDDDLSSVDIGDLSFSAVLPDGDTTIRASIPMRVSYDGSSADFYPSLSAEHVFDWGHGDDALMDLQAGNLDGVLIDLVVANYRLEGLEDDSLVVVRGLGDDMEENIYMDLYGIGFRKGDDALSEAVWNALLEMKEDGTLAEISTNWFGSDITVVEAAAEAETEAEAEE